MIVLLYACLQLGGVCIVLQREAELNAVSSTWFEPFAALLEVHSTIMLQQYQLHTLCLLST
jgi:hypothetical protein